MFDTAFVMVDALARPVVIIPESLPAPEAALNIVDGGIDICVGTDKCGAIRGMADETLAMLGLHEKVGIATFRGKKGEALPSNIQYVATVTETRF